MGSENGSYLWKMNFDSQKKFKNTLKNTKKHFKTIFQSFFVFITSALPSIGPLVPLNAMTGDPDA